MSNHSTIPDSNKVITLGHTSKQPLIRRSSELVDGLEPHDMFLLAVVPGKRVPVAAWGGRGVPGVEDGWVPGGRYTGY